MKILTVGELRDIIEDIPDDAEVIALNKPLVVTNAIGKCYGFIPTTENYMEGVWTLELKMKEV